MSHESTKRRIERAGLPYTRENYIRFNWGRAVPDAEWTAEHEDELPPELQDWSRFSAESSPQSPPNPATGNHRAD